MGLGWESRRRLNTRVGTQDFLAVSYVTAAGDTIGTFPAVNGVLDTLELIYEPRRGTDVPTFPYEMRNAYRIGSSDMDRGTTRVAILVNNSETPIDGQGTYLSRLDVSLAVDASSIDEFNRLFPRVRDPGGLRQGFPAWMGVWFGQEGVLWPVMPRHVLSQEAASSGRTPCCWQAG